MKNWEDRNCLLAIVSIVFFLTAMAAMIFIPPVVAASAEEEAEEHSMLGGIDFLEGRYEQALVHAQTALELYPRPDFYRNVELILQALIVGNRLQQGLEELKNTPIRHAGLRLHTAAMASWLIGSKIEARELFERAVTVSPDTTISWVELGQLLDFGFGRTSEAIAAYEKAIATSDANPLNIWAKFFARHYLERLRANN